MLIKNEDLYDLLNVKVGDKIRIINGGGYATGHRFEIVDNGNFMNGHCNNTHGLSRLIGVEFEKFKEYKRISLVSAVILLSIKKKGKVFIKNNDKYHTIKSIEVREDEVVVWYNHCENDGSRMLQSTHKKIDSLAFYEEMNNE